MDKKAFLRQFISPFIQGPNFDAILGALADEAQKQEDLSIAVNNQLTISTSSGIYLDKNMAGIGITRPSELGMEDLAFKKIGIQINAQKQVTESIHAILSTFYGDDATRAYVTSTIAGPYELEEGDDLILALEDGTVITLVVAVNEFENIQQASADELANVITRFIRSFGYNGYAEAYLDVDTGLKYIRIFGGAKGPYSFIQILGGKIQSVIEFPTIRNTFLSSNTTVWQITRNIGSTYRFRWESGPKPLLDQIFIDDKVMIYGSQFESLGIRGTFTVTQIRPSSSNPSPNAGYFEVELLDYSALKSSAADQYPPANTPSASYSFTVTQNSFDDLKFFLPKKNTPYSQIRYSLAWEPSSKLLKVYMPAITKIVKRQIIGSGHLHLLYGKGEFNGAWGSISDTESKIQIITDRSFRYKQKGNDAAGSGGKFLYSQWVNGTSYGINTLVSYNNENYISIAVNLNQPPDINLSHWKRLSSTIDYVFRENGYTTIVCSDSHGMIGAIDEWNRSISSEIITVYVENMLEDDPINSFLGPYIVDPSAPYTLTGFYSNSREKIFSGEIKTTLLVEGSLPSEGGLLIFDLNKDTQEGPVKYLNAQGISGLTAVNINTISQNGTTVTVNTMQPHGMIAEQNALISNTVNFNGTWKVKLTPNLNTFIFEKTPAMVAYETSGNCMPVVENTLSTLVLDPAYVFKYNHEIGSDITLLSDTKAYAPAQDGTDYGLYLTGTADGRIFAEQLIKSITAAGINLQIVIIYPSDVGLGNMGKGEDLDLLPVSDKVIVWGPDDI